MRGLRHKQFYWPDTNVLVTRFLSADGVGQITDFMPVGVSEGEPGHQWLVRRVNVVRQRPLSGLLSRLQLCPRPTSNRDLFGRGLLPLGLNLELATRVPLKPDGGVFAEFALQEGRWPSSSCARCNRESCNPLLSEAETHTLFHHTVDYWRRWLAKCSYHGRWREMVHRAALCSSCSPTSPRGPLSPPPPVACRKSWGGRNWDYRYTWIRDTSFTLYALLRIGFTAEAGEFMHWLEARCHEIEPDGSLQIMYGIDGRHTLTEEILDHLEGYMGSRPVRAGMPLTSSSNWISTAS